MRDRKRLVLVGFVWAVFGVGYLFLDTQRARAALPACIQCTCKMCYAWKNDGDSHASGFKTQANPPVQLQNGLAVGAKACPDPPTVHVLTTVVDRYEYQNPVVNCDNANLASVVREADVSSVGTKVATGLTLADCVN